MAPQQKAGKASTGNLEWLRADTLSVDPSYQRPVSTTAVRIIVENFDPDAFGTLVVSRRADGMCVLLDGQQRQNALLRMGWGDQQVPCIVHVGMDASDEAAVFTKMNVDRSRPHPVHIFEARVVAGETEALAVAAVLDTCGVKVSAGGTGGMPMTVTAIAAVETTYRVGGAPLLTWVLRAATEAWMGENGAFSAGLIVGLALFHRTYGSTSRAVLTKKLRRLSPREIDSRARQLKALEGGAQASMVARILVGAYNWRTKDDDKLDAGKVPSKFQKSGFGDVSGPGELKRKATKRPKSKR